MDVVELDVVVVEEVVVPPDVVVGGAVGVLDVPVVPVVVVGVIPESGALVGVVAVVPPAWADVPLEVVVGLVLAERPGVGAEEVAGLGGPWPIAEVAAGGVALEVSARLTGSPDWFAATSSVLRMAAYCFMSAATATVICAPVMLLRSASPDNLSSCPRM